MLRGVVVLDEPNLSLRPCNDLGPNLPSDLTPIKVCNCCVKVPVGVVVPVDAGVVGVVVPVDAGVVGVVVPDVGVEVPGIASGSW